jgi:hypothetical protein
MRGITTSLPTLLAIARLLYRQWTFHLTGKEVIGRCRETA